MYGWPVRLWCRLDLQRPAITAVQVTNERQPLASHVQSGTGSSSLIELYALGLRAGQHLSRVSHTFMAGTLQLGSMMSSKDDIAIITCLVPEAEAIMSYSTPMASATAGSSQSSSPTLDLETSSIVREWASYLGSQWPERRWQLIKRPDGLELLVRDYHLSRDEQEALVAELLARIPSSSQPPERIWLNGQMVWQAEPAPHHAMKGGRHGR